jgi:deoxyribonuclease-4
MSIKFGPAGLGGVREAILNLEKYHELGLKACEIAFTYGVYIKNEKDAKAIGKKAKELGINLSVHAPYWINLNSSEEGKIEKSKERIFKCLEVGTLLGAEIVVFHPGYYGDNKENAYSNIKMRIIEIMETAKEKKYTPKLAPETMGKINVFGSVEEISKLAEETKCAFCIDFAHILAREKHVDMKKIKKLFPQKSWHCHFSGIEYGEKGEKKHKSTEEKSWKELFGALPNDKEIVIINEAPNPVDDAVLGLNIYKDLEK